MVSLNFVGGATPDVTTSWTGYGSAYSNTAANGVALPTNRRLAANGNRPVYVATAQCYWAGRGGTRTLRLGIGIGATGGKYSGYVNVGADTSANASGQLPIGTAFPNGGNQIVKIDESGSSGFYFGRATGSTGTTDPGGGAWGPLSGSLVYYEVPDAPTSVTVVQAGTENAVNILWTAPTDTGGMDITDYAIKWSYNSGMTGATTIPSTTSSTSYKLTGLGYGQMVYVQVAAVNSAATAAGTTSVFSSTGNGFITAPDLPLDGWANYGTVTNNTFTIKRTSITALIPKTGIIRTGTASVSGGSYATGAVGIQKTYTNLVIGRQYIMSGKAILNTAGVNANIYRFAVTGIGNGTNVTLTSATVGATIPSYTFTATATTHVLQIQLAETFTATTGLQETVSFYDFALTRVATDLTYRVQDNLYSGSLVDHFDLATQSVGAYWWVDKKNVTQFVQDFDYSVPVATFSDLLAVGSINYSDISVSYDTANVVNQIIVNNLGSRVSTIGSDKFEEYTVAWSESDATSITNWGARQFDLTTNLWTQVNRYNWQPNPSLAASDFGLQSGNAALELLRVELATNSTGATGYLTSGATQPVTGAGSFVSRGRLTAQTATVIFIHGGSNAAGVGTLNYIVTPSTQYTASTYLRSGVGHNTSLTGRADIRWFTDTGTVISTSSGTASTVTATGWTRVSVTATAPATAAYGTVFSTFIYGGANNTGFRYYATAQQMETAATASAWFSGDTTDDLTYVYEWEGLPGESRSIRYLNMMDTRTGELLTEFGTPSVTVSKLRWNTGENTLVAATLDIGSVITVTFKGTTANYRVVGINHDITTDKWMMEMSVAKVT